MLRRVLILTLVLGCPAAWAQPTLGTGTGDQERGEDGEAHPAPADPAPPTVPVAAPAEAVARATPPDRPGPDYVPATWSVSLDLGGSVNLLGGMAYPKIAVKGQWDEAFYTHGLGPGFKLHWDFPAQDLDWRLGVDGTLPGYAGLEATVGVRKDLAPWTNPRVLARAAAGLEFLCAAGKRDVVFLVPVFLGKAEVALEITLVENLLSLGTGVELGLRYGIPLGVGLDFGGFIRTEVWF